MLDKLLAIRAHLVKKTAHFDLKTCMNIIDSGRKFGDPIENLFTRRYLLTRLFQAYQDHSLSESDLNIDWLCSAEKKIANEFVQFFRDTQKNKRALYKVLTAPQTGPHIQSIFWPKGTLRDQTRTIPTEGDIKSLQQQGITLLNYWQPTLPFITTALIWDLLIGTQSVLMPSILMSVLGGGLIYLELKSDSGTRMLNTADTHQERLTKFAKIKEKYLPSNTPAQEEKSYRTTSEYEKLLDGRNETQTLFGGIGCIFLSNILLNGPRNPTFWFGVFLMALSILYYQNPSRYEQQSPRP